MLGREDGSRSRRHEVSKVDRYRWTYFSSVILNCIAAVSKLIFTVSLPYTLIFFS